VSGLKGILPTIVLVIFLNGLVTGCQRDLPKPETKPKVVPIDLTTVKNKELVSVFYTSAQEIPSIFVQHQLKGNDVLIECIVTGISFRDNNQRGQKTGKIVVLVDGKRNSVVTAAAFIIKGLNQGRHRIKLEVVNLNNEPYGLMKEFMVNVPK
jgi:hypothetical protein